MIIIDCRLDLYLNKEISDRKLSCVTLQELTADLFLGDIIFRIDDAIFDALWGWIPILDFALMFHDACVSVEYKKHYEITFLENTDKILFDYNKSQLIIHATYTDAKAIADLPEIKKSSVLFLRKILDEWTTNWPELSDNSVIQKIYAVMEDNNAEIISDLHDFY